MRLGDTIVAVASAPGRSARGIVRATGPHVRGLHESLLGVPWPGRAARTAPFAMDAGRLPCLVITYEGPRSFTGGDVMEVLAPGNPAMLERMVDQMTAMQGVRRAGPGEFTARAYLQGRLSLDRAEGVAMTIAARTGEELDAAMRLLRGETGARYHNVTDAIAGALSLVEAGIDFADQEDVVVISASELRSRFTAIERTLTELLGAGAQRRRTGTARVAIVGRPNAGKSTLFNALLGRERAIVSDVAGTTRDVIVERLSLSDAAPGAGEVEIVDLAGLDEALVGAIDQSSQEAARRANAQADAIIHCDPTGRFDLQINSGETPVLRVRTKADLPHEVSTGEEIAICAIDGWNLGALKRAIADAASATAGGVIAARHAAALRSASDAIASASKRVARLSASRDLEDAELIALDLREALDAMGSITGQVTPDDVIGRIFASFCIGK